MKRAWSAALVGALLGLAAGAVLFRVRGSAANAPAVEKPGARTPLYYRDPMNPAVTSPTPRKSSDGMDYVPVYADEGEGPPPGAGPGAIRVDPVNIQNSGVTVEPVSLQELTKIVTGPSGRWRTTSAGSTA